MGFVDTVRKQWKEIYFEFCEGIVPTAFVKVIAGRLKKCELPNGLIFGYDSDRKKFTLTNRSGCRVLGVYDPVQFIMFLSMLDLEPGDHMVDRPDNMCYDFLDIDVPAEYPNGDPVPTRGRYLLTTTGKDDLRAISIVYGNQTTVQDFILPKYLLSTLVIYLNKSTLCANTRNMVTSGPSMELHHWVKP